jgi:argininosuccinate lyase
MKNRKTIVGAINEDVLTFTVGKDPVLDTALAEADCIGSAAHATMLARLKLRPALFSSRDRNRVVAELVNIIRDVRNNRFRITDDDQDVHLAVERRLTEKLGDLGRRIHTGRSRNDQVALDLRLYTKTELLALFGEAAALADALTALGRRFAKFPMVGRTHMQPAMPSSVGLWATSYTESLLDDLQILQAVYRLQDRSPLGAAAGFGVPLPLDRRLTARLLGFTEPVQNVLYASGNARGKCESQTLMALSQIMLTLSRLAEDLIIYSTPEFAYFSLPAAFCTGSSIMPQKRNPDVLELIRAKASTVLGQAITVASIIKALPGGYNRDLQETKEPFIEGLRTTRASLRILAALIPAVQVNRDALRRAFTPDVFATDRALEWVAGGMSFRDAYNKAKETLSDLEGMDPHAAIARKTHYGATAGLDFAAYRRRTADLARYGQRERRRFDTAISRLLGVRYPDIPAK